MGTSLRRLFRILIYSLGAILSIFLILYIIVRTGMVDFTMSEEQIEEYFAQSLFKPESHYYHMDGKRLHYVSVGNDTLPTILFIHGSPGTWDAFAVYMKDSMLQSRFRMISVDRVGYGKSEPGQPEASLYKQARYILPVIDQIPDSIPLLVAGHSYGGPVALRLAMDYPGRIDGLLLLAGLADPDYESRPRYQKWLCSPYLRWLLPKDLDVSNREIVPLKEELQAMLPHWDQIQARTMIVQGTQDVLVDPQHATFTEAQLEQLSPSLSYLNGVNHFFIWTQPELVRHYLIELQNCLKMNYQDNEF